jgi:hypothetical protein
MRIVRVTEGPLLDCWQYEVRAGIYVVIVTYGGHVLNSDPPVVSHEHKQAGLFAPGAVLGLVMPEGYKRSIADWFARLDSGPGGLGQRPPTGRDGGEGRGRQYQCAP